MEEESSGTVGAGLTEVQAIAASSALRALAATAKVYQADIARTQAMRNAQEAMGWVSIPIAPDFLANALVATDLVTVRRAAWRQNVRKKGLKPEVVPLPNDLPDVDVDHLKSMRKDDRRKLDVLTATVLQLRGDVLRVVSGSSELCCRVDLPLEINPSAPLYQSKPFRVTLVNLYGLLADPRSERSRMMPCAEEWLRYNAAEHTLELNLASNSGTGVFRLTTQPLIQEFDQADFGAPTQTTIAFDPALLQLALDSVSVSLPDRSGPARVVMGREQLGRTGNNKFKSQHSRTKYGRFPFVEIRSGRALCVRDGVSISVFRSSELEGLELRLEADDVQSLAQALGRLDPANATLRTSPTRYVFNDGVLSISVRRCRHDAISDADEQINESLFSSTVQCSVNVDDLLSDLQWSFWGLTPQDRRTHVRFGQLYRPKKSIMKSAEVGQDFCDLVLSDHVVLEGVGPQSVASETTDKPVTLFAEEVRYPQEFASAKHSVMPDPHLTSKTGIDPARLKAVASRSMETGIDVEIPQADAVGQEHQPNENADIPIAERPAVVATDHAAPDTIPMSQWQPSVGWDTGPNGMHTLRDCLVFLTPGSRRAMGWNPIIFELNRPAQGDFAAEWLKVGQIYDIRQLYQALLNGNMPDVIIHLLKHRIVIEKNEGKNQSITILLAQDADNFWKCKLMPHWTGPEGEITSQQ